MSRETVAVQTIEQTGKRWKLHQALGGGAIFAGILLTWLTDDKGFVLDALIVTLLLGGVYAYVVGRVGAWWYNG